jgi:tetratricopeptide (TPR) repeat protein
MGFYSDASDSAVAARKLETITSLMEKGEYELACNILNTLIAANPDVPNFYAIRSVLYMEQDKFTEALDDCKKFEKMEDLKSQLYLVRGIGNFCTNKPILAETYLDSLINFNPHASYLYNFFAYKQSSKFIVYDEFAKEMAFLIEIFDSNFVTDCKEVHRYISKANYQDSSGYWVLWRTMAFFNCHEYDSAVFYGTQYISVFPSLVSYYLRFRAYFELDNLTAANQDFNQILNIISIDALNGNLNLNKYWSFYYDLKKEAYYEYALKYLNQLLHYYEDKDLLYEKILICTELEEYAQADSCVKKFISTDTDINETNIESYIEFYIYLKRFENVERICTEGIEGRVAINNKMLMAYLYKKRGIARFQLNFKVKGCEDIFEASKLGDESAATIYNETCKQIKK